MADNKEKKLDFDDIKSLFDFEYQKFLNDLFKTKQASHGWSFEEFIDANVEEACDSVYAPQPILLH